jgi:hypothetical protein
VLEYGIENYRAIRVFGSTGRCAWPWKSQSWNLKLASLLNDGGTSVPPTSHRRSRPDRQMACHALVKSVNSPPQIPPRSLRPGIGVLDVLN